jgi:dCMP deaminase
MKPKLQLLWMDFARRVADMSTCSRLKVACILVSMDGERCLSFGYNGVYRGGPNGCISDEPGACGCVHAEANALVKCRPSEPFVAFVTHTPCFNCASLLVNSEVREIYAWEAYRNPAGWDLLRTKCDVAQIIHRK